MTTAYRPIDRAKTTARLHALDESDLRWLAEAVAAIVDVHANNGADPLRANRRRIQRAAEDWSDYFEDVLTKHHGSQ